MARREYSISLSKFIGVGMKKIIKILVCFVIITSCNGQNKKGNLKLSNYKVPVDCYVIDSTILNFDNKTIKIIALEKIKNKNIETSQHNSLPVVILEKNNNSYVKIGANGKVFFAYNDNCPADGFQGIIAKGNYFTLEQTYCLDFKYVYSYTTFKINEISHEILLHKFSETYTSRSDTNKNIPDRIWTKKDFGEVKFENVTEDFLKGLRKNNPKK